MARPALRIEVTTKDQKELRKLLRGGVQPVRVVLRALALLQLAKGLQRPAGRVCPLDRAAGGRGSHQKAACSQRGKRNHPGFAAPPRTETVAGKNVVRGRTE